MAFATLNEALAALEGLTDTSERLDALTEAVKLSGQLSYKATTTAAFAQPGLLETVVVAVDNNTMFEAGMTVQAQTGGDIVGYYQVTGKTGTTQLSLKLVQDDEEYPETTIFLAGTKLLLSGHIEPGSDAPNAPVFSGAVANSDGTFTISWTEANVSNWVKLQWGVVEGGVANNAKTSQVITVAASDLSVRISPEYGPGNYWIRGWTQANAGPTSAQTTIKTVGSPLVVGLTAPSSVSITSPFAFGLVVTWASSAFDTFLQIFGPELSSGNNFYWEGWFRPGQTKAVLENLPHGAYSYDIYHKGIGNNWSAKVSGVLTGTLTKATLPLGLGAAIIDNSILRIHWTSFSERYLQANFWRSIDEDPRIYDADNKWIDLDGIDTDSDLYVAARSRYEWEIPLPRAGNWHVRLYAQTYQGQKSNASDQLDLTAANGYVDAAASTATWANVTGTGKPADNADVTVDALEVGLEIDSGGLSFTGDNGFIKHRYSNFTEATLDGTGGFFLGKVSGGYGFLIGDSSNFFRYDPAATEKLKLQMGTGDDKITMQQGLFRLGDSGGDHISMYFSGGSPSVELREGANIVSLSSAGALYAELGSYTVELGTAFSLGTDSLNRAYASVDEVGLFVGGKFNGVLEDELRLNNTKVLGPSIAGWSLPTGTLTRSTFNPSTVTLEQLAERFAAMVSDLHAGSSGKHALFKA
jgi:hypothetical protein